MPGRDDRGRHRSRSRQRRGEAPTYDPLDAKLEQMQKTGQLDSGMLDDHAQAMLRRVPSEVALQALDDWERNEMRARRNPSACMVALLRRLSGSSDRDENRGRRGYRGDVDEDTMAQEQLEELLAQLDSKVDTSARKAIGQIAPHQAVSILSDISMQLDSVRNPSAFVVTAVKRITEGKGGAASSGGHPRKYGHGDRGDYSGRGSDYNGYEQGGESGYSKDGGYGKKSGYSDYDKRDDYDRSERGYDRTSGYERRDDYTYEGDRYERGSSGHERSAGHDRNNHYDRDRRYEKSDDYDRDTGYDRSGRSRRSHSGGDYGGRNDIYRTISRLMHDMELDTSTKEALTSLEPEVQVDILNDLVQNMSTVRNQSAFVLSNIKRYREGKSTSRRREEGSGHGSGRDGRHHGHERGSRHQSQVTQSETWDKLDDKAKEELYGLSERDAAAIMHELESKGDGVRNPSAFVSSVAKRYARVNQEREQQETASRHHHSYDDEPRERRRSRSRRRDGADREDRQSSTVHLKSPERGRTHVQRRQVKEFLATTDLLDQSAKAALADIPSHEAVDIIHQITSKSSQIRNHSAFVMGACNKIAQTQDRRNWRSGARRGNGRRTTGSSGWRRHRGTDRQADDQDQREEEAIEEQEIVRDDGYGPQGLEEEEEEGEGMEADEAQGDGAAEDTAAAAAHPTEDWRSMDLSAWLHSVDNGRGHLLQYEKALTENYDSLDQIIDLYVSQPDSEGRVSIDSILYEDLNVDKVGHRRLFEKWFKERLAPPS